MVKRKLQVLIGLAIVVSLLLSCAPAAQKSASAPTTAPSVAASATALPSTVSAPAATPKPATSVVPAATAGSGGETPVYGGTFTISFRDDLPSFDVHQESIFIALSGIGNACYNTLLTWDHVDHKKMIPDLAKRWESSPDGLTYTFYLEEGVKWHDGAPFTAEDVKFSIMRQKDPSKGVYSVSQSMYDPVKSLEVTGPYTVRVQTSRPYSSLVMMMTLTNNSVMPKHILEKQLDMKKDVIGTGPWKLKKYTRAVSLELEKNPQYFKKGLPYMDRIMYYMIPDSAARLAAFRTGRVLTDITDHEPPAIDIIEKTMSDVAIAYRIPGNLSTRNPFVAQNKPPFNDVRVRQAIGLALDRWEYCRMCETGMYSPGGYMVPGGLWALPDEVVFAQPGYAKAGPAKDAERERARKLLAEAGYPNGFDLAIEARNGPEYICEATWLKAQFEKIGLRATIKVIEAATYYEHLRTQDYQIMSSGYGYTVDDPDLVFGEAFSKDGGKNWGKYYNPDFDKLILEQTTTVDPAKRREIVNRMQMMLHETVPFPVLGWRARVMGVWKKVKGYVPWTSNGRLSSQHRHDNTWLDPKLPPL